MAADLQGQVILNTRPAHQQAGLSAMLTSAGARVLSFPVIEIQPVAADKNSCDLSRYDILLFVSRNARKLLHCAKIVSETSDGR